jgi:hypothetical protein
VTGTRIKKYYLYESTVPEDDERTMAFLIRDSLTILWSILTFLSLLFSVYGLLGKIKG